MMKRIGLVGVWCVIFAIGLSAQSSVTPSVRSAIRVVENVFDVRAYGALCNGINDDTAALQAAADAAEPTSGTVLLPAGTCIITSTVTFGNKASGSAGGYSAISLRGQSQYVSNIKWNGGIGTPTTPALAIRHMSAFHWSRFALTGPSNVTGAATQGTSIGILVDGCIPTCGAGTMATLQHFESINVGGFRYGFQSGGTDSASEMVCIDCGFNHCDQGFHSVGFNSLNYWFFGVHLGDNATGMVISDGVHVFGGDTFGSTAMDFDGESGFGRATIVGVRAQLVSPTLFFRGGNVGVTLQDNILVGSGAGHIVIDGCVTCLLIGNSIQGQVRVREGRIEMHQNSVYLGTSPDWPLILPASADQLSVDLSENWDYDVANSHRYRFADRRGTFTQAFIPIRQTKTDFADSTGSGENLQSVRSLAFGSAVAGKNLRLRASFATAATVNVTFARTASVTINGTYTISFLSGVLTATDIGQAIALPGAVGACVADATGTTSGLILTVPSATTATVAPRTWQSYDNTRCRQQIQNSGTITATIGENEPDANYFVTLGCDKNETFAISSKATTGFTITSSNASSTATCDVILVR